MHLILAFFKSIQNKTMLTCKQLHPTVQRADIFLKFRKAQEENVLVFPPCTESVAARLFIMGDQCLDTIAVHIHSPRV